MQFDLRRALLTAVTALVLLPAASASAATGSLGQAVFGDWACYGQAHFLDSGSPVTTAGTITAFSYANGTSAYWGDTTGSQLDFKVYRKVSDSVFTVVGTSGVKTLTGGTGVDTFTVPAIAVQPGDMIGFWAGGGRDLPGCVSYQGSRAAGYAFGGDGNSVVGSTVHGNTTGAGGDLNVAARLGTGSTKRCAAEYAAFKNEVEVRSAAAAIYSEARTKLHEARADYAAQRSEANKTAVTDAREAAALARAGFLAAKERTAEAQAARRACLTPGV